jgi:hypothetical protein
MHDTVHMPVRLSESQLSNPSVSMEAELPVLYMAKNASEDTGTQANAHTLRMKMVGYNTGNEKDILFV